jgi:hypothetical protein
MKFVMLHTVPSSFFEQPMPPEIGTELAAWHQEMDARGVHLDGARLEPLAGATTVRRSDGRTLVNDGPFAETKEQVAGYNVIECDDLDSAVAVASAHPTTRVGSIEVRAFHPDMPDPDVSDTVAEGKRRYLMLVCAAMGDHHEPADSAADDDPEGEEVIERWISDAGPRRIYGWALRHPSEAVTVRRVDDQVVTTDGPFAETKEQVAGFDLLECADLDDAIEVAAGHPVADGGVLDLRPVLV